MYGHFYITMAVQAIRYISVANLVSVASGVLCKAIKKRLQEFEKYPKYKQLYISAFDKMLSTHIDRQSKYSFKSGIDVFNWWVGIDENQMTFFEEET